MWISGNVQTSENGKKVIVGNEFKGEWGNSLAEWRSEDSNVSNPVGDCYRDINHELEEDKKVNNAIGENKLGNPQYN